MKSISRFLVLSLLACGPLPETESNPQSVNQESTPVTTAPLPKLSGSKIYRYVALPLTAKQSSRECGKLIADIIRSPTNSFEIGQAKSKRYLLGGWQLNPPSLIDGTVTIPDGALSETEPGLFTAKAFESSRDTSITYLMSVKVAEQGTSASGQFSISIESVAGSNGLQSSEKWIAPGCSARIDFDGWLSL